MTNELKENEMLIVPLDKFSYQLMPLNENAIVITLEEFEGIKNRTKRFDLETMSVVDYDNSRDKRIAEIHRRISELKSQLSSTDYQAIKYAEGIISEEEYLPVKELRQSYRLEINQLEDELKQLENK